MKANHSYVIAILLSGISGDAQAQSASGFLDGIQSSVSEFVDGAAKGYESLKQNYDDEVLRLAWLTADIRMSMNAKFEAEEVSLCDPTDCGDTGQFFAGIYTGESKGSLYAEFDWQNQAQSMRVKSSEKERGAWAVLVGAYKTSTPAKDFTMYIDAQNYWYVPTEEHGYVRIQLMDAIQNVAKILEISIEAAVAGKVTEMLDELRLAAALMLEDAYYASEFQEFFPTEEVYDVLNQLHPYYDSAQFDWDYNYLDNPDGVEPGSNSTESKLKSLLEELAYEQVKQLSMFPAFIHFASIISPTLVRTRFNVREESISFMGQTLATRMTIVSGKDAGYEIAFDRYGRLIHLRDTDGSTAEYWYDKDVTVTIPPATSINLGSLMQLNKN